MLFLEILACTRLVLCGDGSNWNLLGGSGITGSDVQFVSLEFYNNTPYIAFADYRHAGKATVLSYDGSSWVSVGTSGFSAGYSAFTEIMFDTAGHPHLAYVDDSLANRIVVMKFGPAPPANNRTVPNAEDGKDIQINTPTGTTITCSTAIKEIALPDQDPDYPYPLGLLAYCFNTSDADNQVTIFFETDLDADELTARTYNPFTHTFSDIDDVQYSDSTLNGHHAVKVVYTVTDNTALDINGADNSINTVIGLGKLAVRRAHSTPEGSSSQNSSQQGSNSVRYPNSGLSPKNPILQMLTLGIGIALISRRIFLKRKLKHNYIHPRNF